MPVMQFSERPYGNLAGFRFCSNGRLVGFWRLAAIGIAGGETRRQTFCYKETPKHLNLTCFGRACLRRGNPSRIRSCRNDGFPDAGSTARAIPTIRLG